MASTVPAPKHEAHFDPGSCEVRILLDRVADKWSLYVVAVLGEGERRFTELRRAVDGISQRMLTVTLRGLERDGIVSRTVHCAMPPNIAYRLTPLGETLWTAVMPLISWAGEHLDEVARAQTGFDCRRAP
jgi:DNA-binding HxlR family transcriptional regulator